MTSEKNYTTKKIAIVALMIGLVYVGSLISFYIPVGIGTPTRLHLGNGFCLLSGMILGPIWGGFAAGVGSVFLDLTNPAYIAGAPITFIFKFLMGAVCGAIAMDKSGHGINKRKNLIGGILGQLTYIVLYIGKTFLSLNLLFGVPKEGAWGVLATKLGSSAINAVFAVLISMALMLVINSRPEVRRQVDQIN
ncbi:ECF transporter S component [Ezakiella coagulans]|uniref:ECF transporter S component n=1 Tax=Ezakiella coagulans TaxID=46507 RepID=UPI002014DD00|nr:ECF transporter S component [Ezakiella coagulans]UQK61459.1 ECF transporter S component [Ezakiella coagulans]